MKKRAVKQKTATNVLESFGYYDREEDPRQAGFVILVGFSPWTGRAWGEPNHMGSCGGNHPIFCGQFASRVSSPRFPLTTYIRGSKLLVWAILRRPNFFSTLAESLFWGSREAHVDHVSPESGAEAELAPRRCGRPDPRPARDPDRHDSHR